MRTDGSKIMSSFSNIRGRVWSMLWSPVEDLLFAVHDDRSNAPQELGLILTIIDPETEFIVAQTKITSSHFLYPTERGWLEDGSGIYVISYEARDATIITILYMDGRVSTKVFQDFYPIMADVQRGRFYSSRKGPLGPVPGIQDLMTGRVLVTDERDPNISPNYYLTWNADMTTALQSKFVCPEPGCYYANVQIALELIDWQTGQRTRLPEYLRFSNLYGTDPNFAPFYYDPQLYNQSWSPDGTRLIFVDNQESGQLYLVEAATGKTTPLLYFTKAYT